MKDKLVTDEEEMIAKYLKENFLQLVNGDSKPVNYKNTIYSKHVKRILDILISLPICIVLFPLNIIFALLTFLDVGTPIFYRQRRVGLNGSVFVMTKFRNMNNKVDSKGELLPASERVTRFGRFMRKFSFDELLNFWNVLKGEMSIIGPRPYPEFFIDRMSERHKCRHYVRPGIECPKMIELPNEHERKYEVKLENDIWYVENVSFKNDLVMCFKLVKMAFSFKTRAKHAGALSYFVGYDNDGYALGSREAKAFLETKGIQVLEDK